MNPFSLRWQDVPARITQLVKLAAGPYQVIQDLIPSLPTAPISVHYNPETERVHLTYPLQVDSEKQASWHIALRQVPGVEEIVHSFLVGPDINEPYIRIKSADAQISSVVKPLASAAQWEPNALNKMWGGPNPLSATIGGGLLGAGMGYAGGWLAEQLLPDEYFEKGRLRKNTALIGSLLGAAPGVWHGFDQQFRGPHPGAGAWVRPFPWVKENSFKPINDGLDTALPKQACQLNAMWEKAADEAGGDFTTMIPVDQFGRVIWNDLRSQGGYTSPELAAATSGLVHAASLSRGTEFISPVDIARIGIGMGSGYLSGLFVGKTLGALAGLKPEAQQTLQQTGIWAGVLSNTVPLVFR